MTSSPIVVQAEANGSFKLNLAREDIAEVRFIDVDLLVLTKSGAQFVLPGAGISSMEEQPPLVFFTDGSVRMDKLFPSDQAKEDPFLNTHIMGSTPLNEKEDKKELEKELEEKEEILLKAQKEINDLNHRVEELDKQTAQQDSNNNEAVANALQEKIVEEVQEKTQKIIEEFHNKDYDYVPPRQYEAQGASFTAAPGVPAPISMTPLVLLTMGNVLGEMSSGATIYGDGGAAGSDAAAKLSPRDALQFSAATITGTAGADTIYAEGPLLGNPDPSVDTSYYAKQFLLRVAGYFTELSDIVFQGLPSYVTVSGGTLQADGSWVLPASYVISQQTFELVYDKDAWRAGGEDTFTLTVVVSGEMRGTTFESTENIRFQFMDVTDVSQVTDSSLTYWEDGENKHIYILPTQDQPNIIDSGAGDDIVYGGRNTDTITVGDGDDTVYGNAGDDVIDGGLGDDTLDGGDGDDTLIGGLGTNALEGGDGTDSADYSASGAAVTASLLAGTATNAGITDVLSGIEGLTGSAYGDILIGDAAANILSGGDGDDTITGNGGTDTLYGDAGNDTITGGADVDTIYGGDGADIIDGGGGVDLLYGGAGDDTFLNPNGGIVYDGGEGTDRIDISSQVDPLVSLTVNMASGTVAYNGVPWFTFSNVEWVIGGSGNDDMSGGTTPCTLDGGAGNDTIRAGSGGGTFIGGIGTNYIYAGYGADSLVLNGTANFDYVYYNSSPSAVVLNFSSSDQSFVNTDGDTITVAALSGTNRDESAADANSWANGDTYTAGGMDYVYTSNYNDVVFGSDTREYFYLYGGDDFLMAGGGNDIVYLSAGSDRVDGGADSDIFYTGGGTSAAAVVYLDGTMDINGNGTADYIDRGITDFGGSGYSGFATGWGTGKVLLTNFENIIGGGNSDLLVGDNNANELNGLAGNNVIHALGGDDLIFAQAGSNTIDGGTGTDTVSFSNRNASLTSTTTGGYGNDVNTSVQIYLADADLNENGAMDRASTWGSNASYTARTTTGGAYSYSTITNVENIVGAAGNDLLAGDANANIIRGYDGADTITGNGGADSLYGDAGNDTILINQAHMATATLISGGTGTDTLRSSGWTFAANSIYTDNAKYSSIEALNTRNGSAGESYTLTAYDVRSFADAGNGSTLSFYVDTGDTVTYSVGAGTGATSCTVTTVGSTDTLLYYSAATLVATMNVYYA